MAEDSGAKVPATDLLGDPWTEPRDPRGRKRHRYTPQLAEKIAVLRATGATKEEISQRVGLSVPTIDKYYFRSLEHGPGLVKALLTEALLEAAIKGGKVGAFRLAFELLERGEAQVPVASRRKAQTEPEEKLGKKAQADVDAQAAHEGTSWADVLRH